MKAAIKANWLKNLKSGKYKKATGSLKTSRGHCCLGVLCEMAVEAGVIKSFNGNYLPKKVTFWSGVTGKQQTKLAKINDSYDRKYRAVSKHITENL